MIRCPYCLEETNYKLEQRGNEKIYKCLKCNENIPRDFIEQRSIPRATVGLVGFTGHGKTVYITSLFYLLKELEKRWRGYYFQTLDDNTHPIMHERVPLFKEKSLLPDGTPINFPKPLLIYFKKIPYFGNYFLSFYDVGGGVFEQTQAITEQGRFVAHSDTVLFILSIDDSGTRWPDHIRALLDRYIRAVYDWMRVDLKKRQHLIVVLTKADTLKDCVSEKRLSKELIDYLDRGSYREYLSLEKEDIEKLKSYSDLTRDWLESKGCGGFITAAEDNFNSVEYTIVSSTGAAPVGKKLAKELEPEDPKRVLDPFLWILEKNRPRGLIERFFAGG